MTPRRQRGIALGALAAADPPGAAAARALVLGHVTDSAEDLAAGLGIKQRAERQPPVPVP